MALCEKAVRDQRLAKLLVLSENAEPKALKRLFRKLLL